MKKITLLIICITAYLCSFSQENVSLDQMLINIDKSLITSGIIYERSAAFADLYHYNLTFDTADIPYFEQALNDLYIASNQTKFLSNSVLRQRYTPKTQGNVIDIGIINSQYNYLNYNSANESAGGLTLANNVFYPVNGHPPFNQSSVVIISPLKDNAVGTSFIYNFQSDLWFNNGTKTIKNVTANLGNGVTRDVIVNGVITKPTVTVNYAQSGYKILKFTVTFNDNTTHVTYGKIYIKVSSALKPQGPDDPIIEDYPFTTALINFQGYDETTSILAQIECRAFYSKGNTQKKIMKPIIISDGFDPGDERKIQAADYNPPYNPDVDRSIEDFNNYVDCTGKPQNLIAILTSKGYDVIIVNYPTYIDNATHKTIDGGADYIERNAMAMIGLIQKVNSDLVANGSTAQLVIVGPSMGGQITRYALAYMEKKYAETNNPVWLHKTKLWISIDSPHLGANIPEGLQALISLIKGDSPLANDFYNKKLGSVAAKQQLINWHQEGASYYSVNTSDLNGRTISQGYLINSGSSFFQQYYNNLFNNGLPNSKGYPINLRKICLVNGSVTGKKFGTYNEQTLYLKGFLVCLPPFCWDLQVATMETYTMPAYETDRNIARYQKALHGDKHTHAPNNDSRGNMDVLPGGAFPGYDDLNSAITGKHPDLGFLAEFSLGPIIGLKHVFFNTYTNKETNCFIPSFSALGIKTPDQNWGQSLKRNLVCSNETPFDSYFGHDDNTPHTSFDCESVNWLLQELDGTPQSPWFPLQSTDLDGATTLCVGNTDTYNFSNLCMIPSAASWTYSSNLQKISSTTTSITMKAITAGEGTITATFANGYKVVKDIIVGAPQPGGVGVPYNLCYKRGVYGTASVSNPIEGLTYNWEIDEKSFGGGGSSVSINPLMWDVGTHQLRVRSVSCCCGVSNWITKSFNIVNCGESNVSDSSQYVLSPNPVTNTFQVKAKGNKGFNQIRLVDKTGNVKQQFQYNFSTKSTTISVANLQSDIYYVQIFDGKTWVGKKLIVAK